VTSPTKQEVHNILQRRMEPWPQEHVQRFYELELLIFEIWSGQTDIDMLITILCALLLEAK